MWDARLQILGVLPHGKGGKVDGVATFPASPCRAHTTGTIPGPTSGFLPLRHHAPSGRSNKARRCLQQYCICGATHIELPCTRCYCLPSKTGNGRKRCLHPCGGQAPRLVERSSETPSPQTGWALLPRTASRLVLPRQESITRGRLRKIGSTDPCSPTLRP